MKKGPVEEARAVEEDLIANPYSRIDEIIDKRRRNLEKRKIRLLQYEEDEKSGKKLTEEQVQALSRLCEVENQIEFVKDIMKSLTSLHKDFNRVKKQRDDAARREQAERERKCLSEYMNYQSLLKTMGKQQVREAFTEGSKGAVKLDKTECSILDFLGDCFNPPMHEFTSSADWQRKCEENAAQVHAVVNGTKEKIYEKRSGAILKEFLEKVVSCEYVQEMVANQLSTEEEVENEKPDECENVTQKEDPKVVFVQGEGKLSKGSSEGDAAEATTTEFGFEGHTAVEANATEQACPVESAPKSVENNAARGDGVECRVSATQNDNPAAWASATNSVTKPEAISEEGAQQNAFTEGNAPMHRQDRRPRGGPRFRDSLQRDGNDRRRVPNNGRQVRDSREFRPPRENYENAYGQGRGSGRGGRGPGRGGFAPRGGGIRPQNSHTNDLMNGYGNGGNYNKYSYNDANPPRRIGINFASDSAENRK